MSDRRQRLDAAITAAREAILDASNDHVAAHLAADHAGFDSIEDAFAAVGSSLDRYAALVALRARYDEHHRYAVLISDCPRCCELDAEADKLLEER